MAKYDNFKSQLHILLQAPEKDLSDEFIQSGLIAKFSLQFELAWKLLQKILQYDGRIESASSSPRAITKAAYSSYDFIDEDMRFSISLSEAPFIRCESKMTLGACLPALCKLRSMAFLPLA